MFYLDFRKAFDVVSRNILTGELRKGALDEDSEVDGELVGWQSSEDRDQRRRVQLEACG